ncbi:hypothetical protein [Paraburkholderia sp.]|uniref:hypothetical protein n=1 Tax=Paraburkholderia sp. TaxID=1926495 RepID=UPI002F402059
MFDGWDFEQPDAARCELAARPSHDARARHARLALHQQIEQNDVGEQQRKGGHRLGANHAASYLAAPFVVAQSDLIANIPQRVAQMLGGDGLVIRQMPVAVPPIQISLYWQERYQNDPGHAWLRRCVTRRFQGNTPRG